VTTVTLHQQTIAGFPVTIKIKTPRFSASYDPPEDDDDAPKVPPEPIIESIAAALARGLRHGGIRIDEPSLLFTWTASEPS
jgi:hypothetical protein